ncbi:MAG: DUF11 domain-containing protein [Bacteroidales bacterium]|nr:DUF11 domain-containing protein [Bacteroidales bacterium]
MRHSPFACCGIVVILVLGSAQVGAAQSLPPPQVLPPTSSDTPTIPATPAPITLSGTAPVPLPGSEMASATASPSSRLRVQQVLPPLISAGKPFTAEITVTNPTGTTVEEVYLTGTWSPAYTLGSANPPPARSDTPATWLLGRIGAGEQRRLSITFVPTSGSPGTEFRTEFEASYRIHQKSMETTRIAQTHIGMTVEAPPVVVVGTPVTIRLDLKNKGTMEAQSIRLHSTMPESLTHPKGPELEAEIGVIPAGHTEVVPLVVTPTRAGTIRAVFKLSGNGMSEVESAVTLTAIEAKLALNVYGPRELPQGWPGTYEVTIRNDGRQAATGVHVQIPIPTGYTDLRATPGAQLDPAANTLVWPVGDLQPGQERKLIWLGVASQSGERTITATARLGATAVQSSHWQTRINTLATP